MLIMLNYFFRTSKKEEYWWLNLNQAAWLVTWLHSSSTGTAEGAGTNSRRIVSSGGLQPLWLLNKIYYVIASN